MATALGCLPSAIDDEPAVNIFNLLYHWLENPPTHVILALRYLGQRKKVTPTQQETMAKMQELGAMMGQGVTSGKAPDGFLDAVDWAESMKARMGNKIIN